MTAAERRISIEQALKQADGPLSASTLAGRFSVSRQIVVGDIALLRAAGSPIMATPRGYVMGIPPSGNLRRTVACVHTPADMGRELYLIVDNGGEALDVLVEHPVYGELRGPLCLRSRYDVDEFLRRVAQAPAQPLSALTNGIHLHTIACPDQAAMDRVLAALRAGGFLLEE